jgi:hypothetical protein
MISPYKPASWYQSGQLPRTPFLASVFSMPVRVDDSKGFDEYWTGARLEIKKLQYDVGVAFKRGDNAYEPEPNGAYRQLRPSF